MKLLPVLSSTLLVFALGVSSLTQAHPGRTAADGCHYCRTNCSSWGETAGTRHCHNSLKPSKETVTDELAAHHDETPHSHITDDTAHQHRDISPPDVLENPVSGL